MNTQNRNEHAKLKSRENWILCTLRSERTWKKEAMSMAKTDSTNEQRINEVNI